MRLHRCCFSQATRRKCCQGAACCCRRASVAHQRVHVRYAPLAPLLRAGCRIVVFVPSVTVHPTDARSLAHRMTQTLPDAAGCACARSHELPGQRCGDNSSCPCGSSPSRHGTALPSPCYCRWHVVHNKCDALECATPRWLKLSSINCVDWSGQASGSALNASTRSPLLHCELKSCASHPHSRSTGVI